MLRSVMLVPLAIAAATVPTTATPPRATRWVVERPTELAGLYRIDVPERLRPSARLRMPVTEVTLLRLSADGASRLENVTVRDTAGVARARVEVGRAHRTPWEVRTPAVAGAAGRLGQLCVEWAGRVDCKRYERDAETGDVRLFADATAASAVLTLDRVR
ncbi:hypothetical protein J421_3640 [Gemmatirosa kalamazoonensis]|uniref:Uncharacterized protein n=1 Tax=Gemmatirosa kalamazoonensis TaxID=861299 RepID=W0RL73_9BACT|nr:hypothetical protein [Gemmatirosa kalamazoonensis]AHG91177.1 hypothetical protein J421_3640 [Gemmatirosa kalamazoonensis]